jgi:hypothetical protein
MIMNSTVGLSAVTVYSYDRTVYGYLTVVIRPVPVPSCFISRLTDTYGRYGHVNIYINLPKGLELQCMPGGDAPSQALTWGFVAVFQKQKWAINGGKMCF